MWHSNSEPVLKFKKRSGIYSNSTGTNTFNPETIEAYSYRWWKYVSKIGKLVVFNDYNYSESTNGHQSKTRDLMRQLGVKIDLVVYSRIGLQKTEFKNEVMLDQYNKLFLAEYRLSKKGLTKKAIKKLKDIVKQSNKNLVKLAVLKHKISKKDLKLVQAKVIGDYEETLANNRVKNAEMRAKRRAMVETVTVELNSLEPLTVYDKYDQVNNFEAI